MVFDNEPHIAERRRKKSRPSGGGIFLAILLVALGAYVEASLVATGPAELEDADAGSEGAEAQGLVSPGEPRHTAGKKRCEFFVLQKILSAREPMVLGQWDINGKRVFRIGFQSPGETGQKVRLCVYDLESRSALLPAIGDQDQWRPVGSTATE